jgi:hypothetical protein
MVPGTPACLSALNPAKTPQLGPLPSIFPADLGLPVRYKMIFVAQL